MQRFITLALILAATASTAHAEDLKWKWSANFQGRGDELASMESTHQTAGSSATACHDDVKVATAEGLPPDTKFRWNGKVAKFADIGPLCDAYQRAYQAGELHAAIYKAEDTLGTMKMLMESGQGDPGHQPALAAAGKACIEAVDRADKLGLGEIKYSDQLYLKDVRAKICDPAVKLAESWTADLKKVQEAARAELEAPFKAVGIKGDKLFTCTQYHVLRGIGGGELEPAQIKKAKVLFALQGGDGNYTLYRFAFKGNKLVRTTSHDYYLRPGARAYR
jgi:hypothetical protein